MSWKKPIVFYKTSNVCYSLEEHSRWVMQVGWYLFTIRIKREISSIIIEQRPMNEKFILLHMYVFIVVLARAL